MEDVEEDLVMAFEAREQENNLDEQHNETATNES